jgi:hypothetical protein
MIRAVSLVAPLAAPDTAAADASTALTKYRMLPPSLRGTKKPPAGKKHAGGQITIWTSERLSRQPPPSLLSGGS